MKRDKITRAALRSAFSKAIAPVIIETRRNFVAELVPVLGDFLNDTKTRLRFIRENVPFPFQPLRRIDPYNLVGAVLPREIIFSLAEEGNVIKIYNDRLLYALNLFPTVNSDGQYQMRRGRKTKTVTTTAFTKELIGINKATGLNGAGVGVSVLDTGATRIHEQKPNIVDFDTVTQQHRDENGHGTWCATCIGGSLGFDEALSKQNYRDVPVSGMAPACDMIAIKCLGWYIGTGSTSGIIEAMSIAEGRSKIISMSLGGPVDVKEPHDDPFHNVIDRVTSKGVIPVIAAGNEGPEENTIGSPGCFDNVVSVGAYDPIEGDIAEFSSRGPTPWGSTKPDCVAPGVNIVSGCVGAIARQEGRPDRYAALSGTSMATPHIAGLIAIMEQSHRSRLGKSLTVGEIHTMLQQLGTEKNNSFGWGKLDWDMYENWLSTEYGVHF